MSKSMNMLRTRRRDNNVKPNRKLDRKSSRGMIYENEELRLKTININAEVERGQSDIKKLKRENEMLKKEIWCLRDEYEKLDKLLKEKEISFSSSSTTCTSETESCSTCSDDSDQVEMSQNLENVQKTNLKNLHVEFDHLSVVQEENSTENSDKTSNRTSIPNEHWNVERNIIKPDQSYPSFEALKTPSIPIQEPRAPKHFFSPIKTSKSCGDTVNMQYLSPTSSQNLYASQSQYYLPEIEEFQQNYPPINPNMCGQRMHHPLENDPRNLHMMTPISKSSTDLIVKMDNKNFSVLTNSTFSNGGNLEQLLNDIENISQDILKLSDPNLNGENEQFNQGYPQDRQSLPDNLENSQANKPYKSELNVVLMPTAMPLIGFDKYRNIQNSMESIRTKSMENIPIQNLPSEPKTPTDIFYPPDRIPTPIGYMGTTPNVLVSTHDTSSSDNPFFFSNGTANDYFANRYNPDNYINNSLSTNIDNKKTDMCNSKTNLLEVNSELVSSENEENLKFRTSKIEKDEEKNIKNDKKVEKKVENKAPKLSIRRKVSIHFKGKKDKKNKSLDQLDVKPPTEKKHSLFDIKFTTETKQKDNNAKTPEIKKLNLENGGLETKISTTPDSKRNSNEVKTPSSDDNKTPDPKNPDKKMAKSASASPERRHVHVKEEAGKKAHKKHKKNDKKNRRSTISNEKFYNDRFLRERSFSVCTERSNMLGFNSAFSMYDDGISDRERTNSLSSCGTIKIRKMSNMSNFPIGGKIPWCGCWGNGCL